MPFVDEVSKTANLMGAKGLNAISDRRRVVKPKVAKPKPPPKQVGVPHANKMIGTLMQEVSQANALLEELARACVFSTGCFMESPRQN